MTDPVTQAAEPAIGIDALDTVVELLARVEDDAASDTFYARLCEATCRLGEMDRAVIFRYDEARRRVRAVGALRHRARAVRRRARHRRVGADRPARARGGPRHRGRAWPPRASCPSSSAALLRGRDARLHADVRGRALERRDPVRPRAARSRWRDAERHLLWTLGKIAALAAARAPRPCSSSARGCSQERIDLAREIHEGVIQRLFGVIAGLVDRGRARRARRASGASARSRPRCATCAGRCSARSGARRRRRGRRSRRSSCGCAASTRTSGSRSRRAAPTPACRRQLEPLAQSRARRGGAQRAQARPAAQGRGAAGRAATARG